MNKNYTYKIQRHLTTSLLAMGIILIGVTAFAQDPEKKKEDWEKEGEIESVA